MTTQSMLDAMRSGAMALMQRVPRVKGYMRTAGALNRFFLSAGASPTFTAQMKLGHRLILDARGPQAWAGYTGKYDDIQISILRNLLPANGVLFDVGANVGYYTVPLAGDAKRKNARIVAFEPFSRNVDRLRANLALNDLSAYVDIQPVALSSEAGSALLALREDFKDGGEVGNASVVHDKKVDEAFKQVPITLARLDDVWPALGLNRLDVIKADIEGHEDLFMQGAQQTLRTFRPIIQMEINPLYYRQRGVDMEKVLTDPLPPDYRLFRMEDSGQLSAIDGLSVFRNSGHVFDEAFAVPAEKTGSLPK